MAKPKSSDVPAGATFTASSAALSSPGVECVSIRTAVIRKLHIARGTQAYTRRRRTARSVNTRYAQITIPLDIMKQLGLQIGMKMAFYGYSDGRIMVTKAGTREIGTVEKGMREGL